MWHTCVVIRKPVWDSGHGPTSEPDVHLQHELTTIIESNC